MTDLRTLSARVSEATGPSRELDAEIAKALGLMVYYDQKHGEYFSLNDFGIGTSLPFYTFSIDAVAALIAERLPGWVWSAGVMPEAFLMPEEPPCSGSVMGNVREWQPAHDEPPEIAYDNYERKAKTPALALLSAALLAIHERKEP